MINWLYEALLWKNLKKQFLTKKRKNFPKIKTGYDRLYCAIGLKYRVILTFSIKWEIQKQEKLCLKPTWCFCVCRCSATVASRSLSWRSCLAAANNLDLFGTESTYKKAKAKCYQTILHSYIFPLGLKLRAKSRSDIL